MSEIAPYAHRTKDELIILKSEATERWQKLFDSLPGEMTIAQDISLRNIMDDIHRIDMAIASLNSITQ